MTQRSGWLTVDEEVVVVDVLAIGTNDPPDLDHHERDRQRTLTALTHPPPQLLVKQPSETDTVQ